MGPWVSQDSQNSACEILDSREQEQFILDFGSIAGQGWHTFWSLLIRRHGVGSIRLSYADVRNVRVLNAVVRIFMGEVVLEVGWFVLFSSPASTSQNEDHR